MRKRRSTLSQDQISGLNSIDLGSGQLREKTVAVPARRESCEVRWQGLLGRVGFAVLVFILLASQTVFGQQPAPGLSSDGRALYEKNCGNCHGALGHGISGIISIAGPSLQAEHDRQTVLDRVQTGKGIMPSFKRLLSAQQIDAVTDYVTQQLATIPLQGGNLGEGSTLFRIYCAPCHGTAARGGALAYAGTNAPSLVGKSAGIIAGTIRWGPGPMPSFPASAISNQQLDSIVKYVQFIQRPPDPGGTPMKYYGAVAEGLIAWIAVFLLLAAAGWIEKKGKG
ncbi:MAG: c-type cytochrome [Candidatus Acidiferrales bacterium]